LRPAAPRTTENAAVRVELEQVKVMSGQPGIEATLRVEKRGEMPVQFDPDKVRLQVDERIFSNLPEPAVTVATNDILLHLVLALPAAAINATYAAIQRRKQRFSSGNTSRFTLHFPDVPYEQFERERAWTEPQPFFRLDLSDALSLPPESIVEPLPPLAVNVPLAPGGGFSRPSRRSGVFGIRFGMGLLAQPSGFGAGISGALGAFGGPQFGRVALDAFLSFGEPLAIGAGLRVLAYERNALALIPYADYGYFEAQPKGADRVWPQGHGARIGLEIDNQRLFLHTLFGQRAAFGGLGGYLHAGPIFMQGGPALLLQAGLNVAIF
jgi:hypothetical protein